MAISSDIDLGERVAALEAENARLRQALSEARQSRPTDGEAQFRAIADSIDQMIWTTLPDGYHDYFNRRWYEYTGMPEGSTDGEEWNGMFHPDDQERAWSIWRHCLATGDLYQIEYRLRHRSGEYRWVLGRAQPVRNESGEIVRWYGTCTDIHALKVARDKLSESQARLSAFMQNTPDALFIKDAEGRYITVNGAFLARVARGEDEVLGRTDLDLFPPAVAERFSAEDKEVRHAARPRSFEETFEFGGERLTFLTRKFPLPAGQVGGIGTEITDRKESEEALRESEAQLRVVLDSFVGGLYAVDLEGRTNLCSRSFLDMLGFEREEDALGHKLHDLIHHSHPDGSHYPEPDCPIYRCTQTGEPAHVLDEFFFKLDGTPIPVEYWVEPFVRDGRRVGAICTFIEISERKAAEAKLRELNETLERRVVEEVARRSEVEEALRQAQKMETLGQLTGGVAHDFNNLLQIVTGNIEILQRNLPVDQARLRRSAENAMKGAERASILTQRLLAFARRQPLEPKPINLNKLVGGMSELLHRTLGETIQVETVLASGLWNVEADPNQLENAMLNLAVNARDAMPGGGKLTIETANTHLDRAYVARNSEILAGEYVVVSVSDTGSGMDEETLERVFEPFFTTKDVGKGTGLGLSMVYGFVKQSGGHVKIYSEPGHGTTVKIYLPRLRADVAEEQGGAEALIPGGTGEETILVCEDDDDVRAYSVEVLRELGYRVLEAADGPSALRLLENGEERIDLLFTDVVLPSGMMGNILADEARAIRPDLKVLFTTGYARNAIVHHGRLDPGVELITKPFSYAELAARIRALLDAGI